SLLWIHLLGLVYVLPFLLYLLMRLRTRLLGGPLLAVAAGGLIGISPALLYNVEHNWESLNALTSGASSQDAFQENLASLVRVGIPVMLGLGQATSSPILFAEDWPHRPAYSPWVAAAVLAVLLLALTPSVRTAARFVRECAWGSATS